MNKSLKTLSRIQKFQIDEQRKLMAEKMNEETAVMDNLRQMDERFAAEKAFSAQNPAVGDFGAYIKRYLDLRHAEEEHLQQIRAEIEAIRDKISDMFKEQKTFEIVDRQRAAAEHKELEQKDQKMLDEIGTNAYIKKH